MVSTPSELHTLILCYQMVISTKPCPIGSNDVTQICYYVSLILSNMHISALASIPYTIINYIDIHFYSYSDILHSLLCFTVTVPLKSFKVSCCVLCLYFQLKYEFLLYISSSFTCILAYRIPEGKIKVSQVLSLAYFRA